MRAVFAYFILYPFMEYDLSNKKINSPLAVFMSMSNSDF